MMMPAYWHLFPSCELHPVWSGCNCYQQPWCGECVGFGRSSVRRLLWVSNKYFWQSLIFFCQWHFHTDTNVQRNGRSFRDQMADFGAQFMLTVRPLASGPPLICLVNVSLWFIRMCHVHVICWHSIASIIHKGVKNVVLVTLMREYVSYCLIILRHQILIWYSPDRGVLHQRPAQPAQQQQAGPGQWLRLQQPHGARRHRHLPLPSWRIQ